VIGELKKLSKGYLPKANGNLLVHMMPKSEVRTLAKAECPVELPSRVEGKK
jgi:hypothetical protein